MDTPRGVVALALVAGLLSVGACKSKAAPKKAEKPAAAKKADDEGKAKAAKKPAVKKKAAAKKAPAKKAPAKKKPVAKKPAMKKKAAAKKPPAKADPRLKALGDEANVRERKREWLVKEYAKKGDDAFASSRFEEARAAYGSILDLQPGHEHAQRRLQEIGAILGERGMTEREALDRATEFNRVRYEQAQMQVANLAREAERKAGLGDHEGAVRLYEQALVIVRLPWGPQAAFKPGEAGLKELLSGAKKTARDTSEGKRRRLLKEAADQARASAAAERAARRNRLHELFRQANRAMEGEKYQTAQNLAEEILRDDPENSDARRLREIAVNARFAQTDDDQRKNLADEWKHVFRQLEEAITPQSAPYTFPDTWEEIQAKRKPTTLRTSAQFTEDPQDRSVRNQLSAARTTVNFSETSIDEAVEFLARIANANIVVLPAAREGKSEEELQVDLKIENAISVDAILDLITRVQELDWTVSNGVVQITTSEAARGPSFVQLYDVKDLATEVKNFPGEEINLDPTGEFVAEEEVPEPAAEFVLDSIQELITSNVDQEVWDEAGSVEPLPPGTLVVRAPAETHKKVQALLNGLRGAGGLQVSIETRFVTVQDNFLQEIGVDMRGLGDQSGGVGVAGKGGINTGATTVPITFDDLFFGSAGFPEGVGSGNDSGVFFNLNSDGDLRGRFEQLFDVALGKQGVLTTLGGLSFQGTYLDDTQIEVILRAVEKNDRATLVIAPTLTAYNGQRANVSVLRQLSYIADFDVEIAQAAQIGDPIVQTLRDGVVLDLRPTVSADRRYITMELRPTIARIDEPIATFQTTLANGPPVTIQLPEVLIQRVRTTVTMPDGGTLMLGGQKFFEERRLDSSVPWINKIPVASFFFQRKGTYLERRNLLVLIRASILRPEENEPGAGGSR